jgi:hypothetical protein
VLLSLVVFASVFEREYWRHPRRQKTALSIPLLAAFGVGGPVGVTAAPLETVILNHIPGCCGSGCRFIEETINIAIVL